MRQLPTKELSGILQAVPTSPTDLTTVNTWINQIMVANTTAGALTLTIADKQGSPQTLVPTVSIPANSNVLFMFGDACQFMSKGVNWQASGVGLTASVFGFVAG